MPQHDQANISIHPCSFVAPPRLLRRMVAVLIISAVISHPTAHAADGIEQFLERHGLHELLATHLEDRINQLEPGEEREEVILQLAELFALLLENERDDAGRAALEERSRRLLGAAPPNTADELRLALLRTSYDRAERIAEQHRLRLASEEEVATAVVDFGGIIEQLHSLSGYLAKGIQSTNARLARASGVEATTLFERLNRLERMHGTSRFLLAWSMYYRAYLTGESDVSGAELLFAEMLQSDVPRPQPEDVPLDLRGFESSARSIIGMAMCKSLSNDNSAMAMRWLMILNDEQTVASVRSQAPAWALAVRLEHDEFRDAEELLRREREARGGLPAVWLRMAAVWALEAERRASEAQSLVQYVIAQLAAAGELQQIHRLAEQYGAENLGASAGGFAIRYVNGLIHYRDARDLQNKAQHDENVVRTLYGKAIEELTAALRARDAGDHMEAAAACGRLLAWAYYFRGDYREAVIRFEAASSETAGEEAAEALWMAIVAMDRLIETNSPVEAAELTGAREALVDRFLAKYPSSPRAATLIVNRAGKVDELSDDEITRLLAIAPTHDSYLDARRRVAQALYSRFRKAPTAQKRTAAEAFLGVAVPLLDSPAAFSGGGDASAAMRLVVHLRRVLEVALHESVANRAAAMRALTVFGDVEAHNPDVTVPHHDEIAFRRLQVHLLDHDHIRAAKLADALAESDRSGGIWPRLASLAMFQYGYRRWNTHDDASLDTLRMIVRYGGRVLREVDREHIDGDVLSHYAAVAEAAFVLWSDHGVEDEGPRAFFLYRRLLQDHPRSATFLRHAAILAGSPQFEEYEFAAECWRALSAGLDAGSSAWFEARYGLMTALLHVDEQRARVVMNQHRQLYPEYGLPPWGERLRELSERLDDGAAEGDG